MNENTNLKSQIEDLCKANSIQYHFITHVAAPRVFINNMYWFNYDTNIDMDNIECYINIITGKNEIINIILEKLNKTIKNGCYFREYEYFEREYHCVEQNTITIIINNISSKDDEAYSSYDKYINFELKIYVGHRINKYYLIDKDDKKTFRIENIMHLQDILNQKC